MRPITIAAVCMNATFSTEQNLQKYFKLIDEASEKKADLIVFPEASLQGYLNNVYSLQMDAVKYQHDNAELVPEGPSTQALIRKAKEKNMYIIWGMIERDPDKIAVLHNIAVLVGPEGYIGKYRKVHQPIDEYHIYLSGNEWPVFDTPIGKIGMLICYDKYFPESARELALGGAELVVLPTAWPLDRVGSDPATDQSKYLFDLFDKVRAAENQVFFISANQVGLCGDTQYAGASKIVRPDGRVISEVTEYGEGIAYATIDDLHERIVRYRTYEGGGGWVWKDRHPETYSRIPFSNL